MRSERPTRSPPTCASCGHRPLARARVARASSARTCTTASTCSRSRCRPARARHRSRCSRSIPAQLNRTEGTSKSFSPRPWPSFTRPAWPKRRARAGEPRPARPRRQRRRGRRPVQAAPIAARIGSLMSCAWVRRSGAAASPWPRSAVRRRPRRRHGSGISRRALYSRLEAYAEKDRQRGPRRSPMPLVEG